MANYLPMLLVSVTTNAIPDDTSVSTQPRGQVDYLSHEWREEDVWRSWRNMTRQKNEIANGMRLENASWRTWWKQRNKLKTVSPETLNWLKDSDVTWLYGPLHTAVDWSPPPKPKADPTSVDKDHSPHDRLGLNTDRRHQQHPPSKPILKHRSISDLLTSALPSFSPTDDEGDEAALGQDDEQDDDEYSAPSRPMLLHTKSDTNITRWARNHPFRKDSPPRIIAQSPTSAAAVSPESVMAPALGERSGSSDSARDTTGSSQDLSNCPAGGGGKKKHISFNTFVEQCIAIDSPQKQKRGSLPPELQGVYDEGYDEGYDEDCEAGYNDDGLDEGGLFFEGQNGSDSEEEDDDILEMRTSSTRSRSSSSSRSPGVNASYTRRSQPPSSYISRPPLVRTSSSDKEHMTIAPIAPTILKTTGVGNHFVVAGFGHGRGSAAHASPPVNLVYVPPLGSGYARSNSGSANGGSSGEEVYRYRESRFSVGDASGSGSRSPSDRVVASPDLLPVPEAEALPIPGPERYGHPPYLAPSARVLSPPMVESPIGAHEEDGFDYFSGVSPQVNTADLLSVGLESDLGVDMMHPPDTVLQGRLGRSRSGSMPEVVVNDVNGAIEERREVEEGSPSRSRSRSRSRSMSRSRSRSRSHSRTPSPAEMMSFESPGIPGVSSSLPMPVSRSNSTHTVPASGSHDTALLSPPEYVHSRGRASSISTAVPSPVITSTPAPDLRSRSFSSDRDSRGRSTTRTSSFSDRERSSSRNGAGSPIGSVSPTASGIGLAAQGRGRMRKSSIEGSMRGRAGRRGCAGDSSASPSSPVVGVESRSLDTIADAIVAAAIEPSLSRSSMESQSPSPTHASGSRAPVAKPALPLPNIPAPIIEEDEHARSVSSNTSSSTSTLRYTSPVDMIKPAVPAPPTSATAPVMAERPQSTIKTSSMGQSAARPVSPTSPTEDGGGLVGRAAEMMSTARGLFGAFWHSGGPSGASVA